MNVRPSLLCALLIAVLAFALPARADSVDDAKKLQGAFQKIIEKVSKAYVMFDNGSGVAISGDGYGLTNDHVAGGKKTWTVQMPNYEDPSRPHKYTATCLGRDAGGDIYLFKLSHFDKAKKDEPVKVPFVELGDSDRVKVGQTVVVLGNPFGFALMDAMPTVTIGVVSDTQKNHNNYTDSLQTDAAINPGNSGGPLISTEGKLIGINGQVAVRFGNRFNTGCGYAISANQIKRFMEALKNAAGNRVEHGILQGLILDRTLAGETAGRGAKVKTVVKDSDAEKAGVKTGDVILKVDGLAVDNAVRCDGLIRSYPAGASIQLDIERDGAAQSLTAKLRDEMAGNPNRGYLGITPRQEADPNGGVVVESVAQNTPAAAAGIQPGDVLFSVGRAQISDVSDLMKALDQTKPGQKINVRVRRGGKNLVLQVTLGKAP